MAGRSHPEIVDLTREEEITIERRVRLPEADRKPLLARETTRMAKVDSRLLAIARGELEPEEVSTLLILDDPFGGLIPVCEREEAEENLDDWLMFDDSELEVVGSPIARSAVPRLCMRATELVALPLDHRSGFLLSHIDGQRTVEEIIDVSHLSPDDTLEVIGALVALRAIAID